MNTSELTGVALDWAVAKCEKLRLAAHPDKFVQRYQAPLFSRFSTDWSMGGAIIEREYIFLAVYDGVWEATKHLIDDEWNSLTCEGDTPLEAAMRCYVASKLGHKVDIPEELL